MPATRACTTTGSLPSLRTLRHRQNESSILNQVIRVTPGSPGRWWSSADVHDLTATPFRWCSGQWWSSAGAAGRYWVIHSWTVCSSYIHRGPNRWAGGPPPRLRHLRNASGVMPIMRATVDERSRVGTLGSSAMWTRHLRSFGGAGSTVELRSEGEPQRARCPPESVPQTFRYGTHGHAPRWWIRWATGASQHAGGVGVRTSRAALCTDQAPCARIPDLVPPNGHLSIDKRRPVHHRNRRRTGRKRKTCRTTRVAGRTVQDRQVGACRRRGKDTDPAPRPAVA